MEEEEEEEFGAQVLGKGRKDKYQHYKIMQNDIETHNIEKRNTRMSQ